MGPQEIGISIATAIMVIYFAIKGIKEMAEHFGWFSKKYKEKVQKQKEEHKTEIKEIVDSSINEIVPSMLQPIVDENQLQREQLDKLLNSSNDTLRNEMVQIYYRYLPYKKILYYDRESFNKLYTRYKDQGGNSFMDDINDIIKDWPVVMDASQL